MKSRFKNVYWHPAIKKWVAKVKVNYKSHHIGSFSDEEAANRAVVDFKIKHKMLDANGCIPKIQDAFEYRNGELIAKYSASYVKAGDVVGSLCKTQGYVIVGHGGQRNMAHHIVWSMFNGEIPAGMEIDHINGIRNDNRIENLRLVSRSENMRNRKVPINNTSGEIGVKMRPNGSYWVVVGGRYIGNFQAFDEACAARRTAAKELGYHTNHGRKTYASNP